jgi:carbon storage regulator CsrA
MLVLQRRTGQEIVIAGDVRVTVLTATKNRVRLGITAPPSVPVMRVELLREGRPPRRRRGTRSVSFSAEELQRCAK